MYAAGVGDIYGMQTPVPNGLNAGVAFFNAKNGTEMLRVFHAIIALHGHRLRLGDQDGGVSGAS